MGALLFLERERTDMAPLHLSRQIGARVFLALPYTWQSRYGGT
jgi:hypothetical protein